MKTNTERATARKRRNTRWIRLRRLRRLRSPWRDRSTFRSG